MSTLPPTTGTWDRTTRTVTLPQGWKSVPNQIRLIVRSTLASVDIPVGWHVEPWQPEPTPPTPPTPPPATNEMVQLITLHNNYRAANGLPALSADSRLMQAATDHAAEMAQRGVLSHTGADGSTPAERITRAGYAWSAAAENIAEGQTSPAQVMSDWTGSPGHQADILGPYKQIGCGRSGDFWTVDFASPR